MKLSVHKRTTGKKGDTNKLRREGNIPGIIYGNNKPGAPIYLSGEEIQALLRNVQKGHLATTIFELSEGQKQYKAIIKDIQYHVATYDVEHIDFLLLSDNDPVTVNVPIEMVGAMDCVGVKLGGFLRQVIRTLKVTCFPKDLPKSFEIDVRALNVADSVRLSDIKVPHSVRPLGRMNEVAVIVGKKAGA